jgi:hypothetical protein
VKLRMGKPGETLERLLPFLTIVAVVTGAWFWFVQPRLVHYLQSRTDIAALEERARTMQQVYGRVPPPPVSLDRTQQEFEARVSADDKVADVAAAIAQAVLASAPAGQLRSFVIETGDRVSPRAAGASRDLTRASADGRIDGADPRLALFPFEISYTPLRVTFESAFDTAGKVLWRMRDLPTVVEVRSATLTRGLPLMRTELLVRVLQRGPAVDAGGPAMPDAPAPPAPGATAPRLAPTAAGTGVPR